MDITIARMVPAALLAAILSGCAYTQIRVHGIAVPDGGDVYIAASIDQMNGITSSPEHSQFVVVRCTESEQKDGWVSSCHRVADEHQIEVAVKQNGTTFAQQPKFPLNQVPATLPDDAE